MLFDAHNHLHDKRLKPYLQQIIDGFYEIGVKKCVVNGTHPDDWDSVLELHQSYPEIIQPALGIHPWRVADRPSDWETKLENYFRIHPYICVGECGLDKWIQGFDIAAQIETFEKQLGLASERNLPISVHCLKAWDVLLSLLKKQSLPQRGIHLHSFAGSQEVANQLLKYNAYFSFSGYFLSDRKIKVQQVFKKLPKERLLIETDAPDMPLPKESVISKLDETNDTINSPLNLPAIYENFAKIRGCDLISLKKILQSNFIRYFEFTSA